MTDHLPECPMLDERYPKHPLEKCDYCEMLSACEQRVREEERERARQIVKGTLVEAADSFPDYDYYMFASQMFQDCNHEIAKALRGSDE